MRLRQGQFSYLPELTDEELGRQIHYAIDHGWGIGIEHTDDPHPRNLYWEMWEQPRFGVQDPEEVLDAVRACRQANPDDYVALKAFSSTRHRQGVMLHIIVQRPADEPTRRLRLDRQQWDGRRQGYTLTPG
jgi:ribulose-bisphosphate carboxylase small chain